jgi:hypothetical protein
MLTNQEKLYVYALWEERIKKRKYLSDILPGNLSTEELIDLVPSALYAKIQPTAKYGKSINIGKFDGRALLHEVIKKHQVNIQHLTRH